jgi:hypothetical protein
LYIETIDAFSKYDNVLAYNVGNEVVTSPNQTVAAPFVKAAARDIRAYLYVSGVPSLAIALMQTFLFLETPSRPLHSLAMPQSMAIPHGLFLLQATSLVIPQEAALAILLSIFSVSTISGCPVFGQ